MRPDHYYTWDERGKFRWDKTNVKNSKPRVIGEFDLVPEHFMEDGEIYEYVKSDKTVIYPEDLAEIIRLQGCVRKLNGEKAKKFDDLADILQTLFHELSVSDTMVSKMVERLEDIGIYADDDWDEEDPDGELDE